MEDVINRFLSVSSGDGSGDGSGYGYGDGSGYGYGYGYGDGYGDGDGDGDGYGYGYGYGSGSGHGSGHGIAKYNGRRVYMIDGVHTLIDSVHGNYALGHIILNDLSLQPCFIAKVGNYFAHGDSPRHAFADAKSKYDSNKPIEERIEDFIKQYPMLDSVAEHSDLYRWHNVLTGSCTFGRDAFAKEHGLDKNVGTMTVRGFIELTRNAYGGDVIRRLEASYDNYNDN